ncbi:MAG: NAD(P)/FAD-dependent oxidoreductase [Chloroflexi bacterium]|nr:NAD(P)/FAD-dependent oxidoreductase [Chloroflexota bacterium]
MGAGYGGLSAALRLERRLRRDPNSEIVLVDQNDYHQLIPRIHEVAAGSIAPEAATVPLERLLGGKAVRFLKAGVKDFRLEQQRVLADGGEIPYDFLVIALGSETDFFGIPGLREHSLTLKSIEDALVLKEHVERMFALSQSEDRDEHRKRLLTFIVGGGGFTGTELAGEMADWLVELRATYNVDPQSVRLLVLEASPQLLTGFDPDLVEIARRILERRGVELRLGTPVVHADADGVQLKTGERIKAGTVIWTGGVTTNSLVASSGLATGVRGRVVVNPYLESGSFVGVYVVGDSALVLNPKTGRPMAPSAQLAVQQGISAARNICADIRGRTRATYRPKVVGEVVSVGRREGLAVVGPLKFDGRLARILKEMTTLRYLYMLGGLDLLLDQWALTSASVRRIRHGLP